jgi:preprotein translocase subunit SecD
MHLCCGRSLGIIAVSLIIALTSSARLGLDLRGGTQIVLGPGTDTVKADAASTDRALGCCATGSTRSASPIRPSPDPGTADHHQELPASRIPARPPT